MKQSTTERIFQFLMNGKPPTRMKKYTRDKTFEFTTDSRTPGYKPKSNVTTLLHLSMNCLLYLLETNW